jgi:hypothetical protein
LIFRFSSFVILGPDPRIHATRINAPKRKTPPSPAGFV